MEEGQIGAVAKARQDYERSTQMRMTVQGSANAKGCSGIGGADGCSKCGGAGIVDAAEKAQMRNAMEMVTGG
jgi:hypothetical protein